MTVRKREQRVTVSCTAEKCKAERQKGGIIIGRKRLRLYFVVALVMADCPPSSPLRPNAFFPSLSHFMLHLNIDRHFIGHIRCPGASRYLCALPVADGACCMLGTHRIRCPTKTIVGQALRYTSRVSSRMIIIDGVLVCPQYYSAFCH